MALKHFRKYAFSLFIPLMVFFAFAGTLAGTFAWYSYVSKVTMTFNGTAISSGEQLQVGIKTDLDLSKYDMDMEIIDGESYAWVHPGRDFSYEAITAFSKYYGYAYDDLEATSSGKYEAGDTLELKASPDAFHPGMTVLAKTKTYQYLPLAFRIIDAGTTDPDKRYQRNKEIWLAKTDVKCDEGDIEQAVRLYTDDGSATRKFLIAPACTTLGGGSHVVAGLLDLNEDGYFDYSEGEETIYGSYTGTGTNRFTPAIDTDFHDINNTGIITQTTFTSKHYQGIHSYLGYEGLTFDTASYISLEDIKPVNDGNDGLTGGQPVCYTANNATGLARLDVKIYLEGWDHSAIDQELNHKFSLGLQFQINRVDL